jgi:hypothetical protein
MLDKHKNTLVTLGLAATLFCLPAAKAQVVESLVGLGFKMIPVAIPLVLMAIPAGIQAAKSGISVPHISLRKKPAAETEPDKDVQGRKVNASADADEKEEASESAEKTEQTPAVKTKPDAAVVRTASRPPRANDNSEWFLDDDNEQISNIKRSETPKAKPAIARSAEARTETSVKAAEEVRVERSVKAVRLQPPPVEAQATETAPKASASNSESGEDWSNDSQPVIMMKMSK